MSKISFYDVWIILTGYLAAIHVGKLSVVIPVLQQDLNLNFTQAGFSLALVQGAMHWRPLGKNGTQALPDHGLNHFRTEQSCQTLDYQPATLYFSVLLKVLAF